jgi:hypothetical protein
MQYFITSEETANMSTYLRYYHFNMWHLYTYLKFTSSFNTLLFLSQYLQMNHKKITILPQPD